MKKNPPGLGWKAGSARGRPRLGGLTGWLMDRLRGQGRERTRLMLLDRIALAPRQSLSLVEAEGRRFLVATSADGAPVFYPLDERGSARGQASPAEKLRERQGSAVGMRVSW